ncbi:DoxX family protein, partial [Nocardiopsis rhodophaea]
MIRSTDTACGPLYGLTVLAVRLAVGWVFAEHAWRARDGGPLTTARLTELGPSAGDLVVAVLPYVELLCAAAFAVGLVTPLSGAMLAAFAAGALWLSMTAPPHTPALPTASPALLATLMLACLPPALYPGRWSMDGVMSALTAAQRGISRNQPILTPQIPTRRPED